MVSLWISSALPSDTGLNDSIKHVIAVKEYLTALLLVDEYFSVGVSDFFNNICDLSLIQSNTNNNSV